MLRAIFPAILNQGSARTARLNGQQVSVANQLHVLRVWGGSRALVGSGRADNARPVKEKSYYR